MKMTVYEKTVDAALPEKLYATGSALHAGSGQLVASHMAMSDGTVASNLSKGVYVVKAIAAGESVVKKVVVN